MVYHAAGGIRQGVPKLCLLPVKSGRYAKSAKPAADACGTLSLRITGSKPSGDWIPFLGNIISRQYCFWNNFSERKNFGNGSRPDKKRRLHRVSVND